MEREGSSSYDVLAPNLEAMELMRKEGLLPHRHHHPTLNEGNDFVEKNGQSTKTSDCLTLKTWRSKIRKTCCHIHAGEHRHHHHYHHRRRHYTLNKGK